MSQFNRLLRVFLLGPIFGLCNRDLLDESSVLQVQNPPHLSQLQEDADCFGGACLKKPDKSKVRVNPDANCEDVSCEKVCDGPVLEFKDSNIVQNTLVGQGRRRYKLKGGGLMKITNVAPGVEMHITDKKGNFDKRSGKYHRKYRSGKFMTDKTGIYRDKHDSVHDVIRIAMEKTGSYEFKFELKSPGGEAVVMEEFPLVFYDIDYYEYIEACGVTGVVHDQATVLTVTWLSDECVKVRAGYTSAQSPSNFDKPTRKQAKASVSFVYEKTSTWTMKFGLKRYSHRWVLFKSSKAVACDTS